MYRYILMGPSGNELDWGNSVDDLDRLIQTMATRFNCHPDKSERTSVGIIDTLYERELFFNNRGKLIILNYKAFKNLA